MDNLRKKIISTVITIIFLILVVFFVVIKLVEKSTLRNHPRKDDFFNEFRRYYEIEKFLDEKSRQYPDLTKLTSIGKTLEDRDIKLIKITDKTNSTSKQIIFIDGGIHAREWASISTALYIIERLLSDYRKNNQDVVKLLKEYEFFVVPLINADGYEYTFTTDRMWRKNRRKNFGTNCTGVDLNRNFPFQWGGEGSSHDPCRQTYCGPKPSSEPESRAVINLIMANKKLIKAYITLHSYGQYWLYPWAYADLDSPNIKELNRVARIGSAALMAVYGTNYTMSTPSKIFGRATGSDDWAHGEAKIPYVYTLEMRPYVDEFFKLEGFILPKSQIIPVGNETYEGIKAVAKAILKTICTDNVCQLVE